MLTKGSFSTVRGTAVKIGATEQARQLIMKSPKSAVEQFEKQYEFSLAAIPKAGHAMAYKSALLFIDHTEANSSEPISCRAGCGACCHQPIFTSFIEFQAIREHLEKEGRKVSRAVVSKQRAHTDDGIYKKLPVPERRCVFLGEDQNCTIYEVRPLTCRRYHVYSPPSHCVSGSTKEARFDVNPRTEGHLSAYFAYFKGDHLHTQLSEADEILN